METVESDIMTALWSTSYALFQMIKSSETVHN